MYTLTSQKFVVSSSATLPAALFLDEVNWEQFSEADLAKHFDNIYRFLQDRLRSIKENGLPLNVADEKELRFVLDAFIQAKSTLDTVARDK